MMINNNFNDKISSLCNLNMGIVAITRVQWPILSCYLPNTLTVFFFYTGLLYWFRGKLDNNLFNLY